MTDDLIRDNPVTLEALRRLPPDVYQERQYRLARAIGVSANKGVLPKEDWMTGDQVCQNFISKQLKCTQNKTRLLISILININLI
jgi:hypothetical protein